MSDRIVQSLEEFEERQSVEHNLGQAAAYEAVARIFRGKAGHAFSEEQDDAKAKFYRDEAREMSMVASSIRTAYMPRLHKLPKVGR